MYTITKNKKSKNLLITLALHLSAGGIFRSMPILMAINASMPNFLEYFLCYLGDRSSTAITGDEASQNTGVGFWFDTAGNLKIFYSFLCFQYLSFTLLFLFSGYHILYFLLL